MNIKKIVETHSFISRHERDNSYTNILCGLASKSAFNPTLHENKYVKVFISMDTKDIKQFKLK